MDVWLFYGLDFSTYAAGVLAMILYSSSLITFLPTRQHERQEQELWFETELSYMMDGLGNEPSMCSSKHYPWLHNHKTEASTLQWNLKICSSDDKNSLHHMDMEVGIWHILDHDSLHFK